MIWKYIRPYREKLPDLWWYSLVMFCFSRIGDVIGLVIGIFIVPEFIDQKQLGAIFPLLFLASFAAMPMNVTVNTAIKFITKFHQEDELGKAKKLIFDLVVWVLILSLFVIAAMLIWLDSIKEMIGVGDNVLFFTIMAITICYCWLPLVKALAQGLGLFKNLILATTLSPLARFVVVVCSIGPLGIIGYFWGTLASFLVMIGYLGRKVFICFPRHVQAQSYRRHRPDMFAYFLPAGVAAVIFQTQLFLEPLTIRSKLSEVDSAGYYMAAVFGITPNYIAPAILTFLFPLVARLHSKSKDTRSIHYQSLLFSLTFGLLLTVLFFFIGEPLLNLRAAWSEYSDYGKYIWRIALLCTINNTIAVHVAHETAKAQFRFLFYCFPVVAAEMLALLLFGHFDQTYSLAFIIHLMLLTRVVVLLAIFLEIGFRKLK